MASEDGKRLRASNSRYTRDTRHFISRSIRLAGSSALILGCGSSRSIIPLLQRGVRTAVFVDTSQPALDAMRANLEDQGVLATVEAYFVCEDAWTYVEGDDAPAYDFIIASKCLGLVFATDPMGRDAYGLLSLCASVLREDGSVFLDHHAAFRGFAPGTRVCDVAGQYYDLATIAGRYSDDVCYNASVSHPEFSQVGSIVPEYVSHEVQVWEMIHYRLRRRTPVPSLQVVSSRRAVVPVPFAMPPMLDFDETADKMYPVNAHGVKRIPTTDDHAGHPISTGLPKFDGYHGVLVLSGPNALFLSGRYRFTRRLPFAVEPKVLCVAELVPTSVATCVLVVVGLVSVGDAVADPLSLEALSSVAPALEQLAPAGIFPTSPDYLRSIKGDVVEVLDKRGQAVRMPVDGVQVTTCGRAGNFIKPVKFCTVDARPPEVLDLLVGAYAATPSKEMPEVDTQEGDGVYEYAREPGTHLWRRGRRRPDKAYSDKPAHVVHTWLASRYGEEQRLGEDVGSLVDLVFR